MKSLFFAAFSALVLIPSLGKAAAPIQLEIRADFKKIIAEKVPSSVIEMGGDEAVRTLTEGTLRDLAQPEKIFPIEVRARGNTSLAYGEADFPKLRVSISKGADLKGTAFEGGRGFRINTHVSDKKQKTGMGRVAGENAPLREHLAYTIADVLGLATPNTRLARITYIDSKTNESITRYAMLLEVNKQMEKRLQAKEVDEMTFVQGATTGIDPVLGAKFFLYQKIVGNRDIYLRVNQDPSMQTEINRQMWNTFVFEKADKSRIPVVYDLDLAGIVTGRANKSPDAYPVFGLNAPGSREIAEEITPLFEKFTKAQLRSAAKQIASKKEELYRTVHYATVDDVGRISALTSLDRYFASIDKILELPVIADLDARFFSDQKLTVDKLKANPVYDDRPGTLRKGTPVRVLERLGDVLKVEIIPIKSDLKEGESSTGYIRAQTSIKDSLSDEQVRIFDERDMSL